MWIIYFTTDNSRLRPDKNGTMEGEGQLTTDDSLQSVNPKS
jgi:hypothetical protein